MIHPFSSWYPIATAKGFGQTSKALEKLVESTFLANDVVFGARVAVYGEVWARGYIIENVDVFWESRQALEDWTNLCPERSKEPLPWITWCLIAKQLPDMQAGKPIMMDAAVCFITQFDTYVRPAVGCSLCDHHVVPPASGVAKEYQHVASPLSPPNPGLLTRTGTPVDSVLVGAGPRGFVSQLLLHCLRRCRGCGALWPGPNLPA